MIRTLAAALATTTCLVALATPALAQTREFNVPAGSLRTALDTFARQSGRQVIYRDDVRSARSPGVTGARTAEDALAAVLAGSGFGVRTDRSGAFAIVKVGNGSADANQASPTADGTSETAVTRDIIVTGTNIRGLRNPTAPTLSYGREEIRRKGYETTQDFIRSLPQNFRGGDAGASEDGAVGPGVSGQSNQEAASGVNLRGLGASSTLVLLNGRRMAPAAFGGIVDISVIPLAALERVDIVTDGSSAIYGGDAVAGVVNFVLRRDFRGGETQLSYGGVTGGSLRSTIASQLLGTTWNGGGIVGTLQYQERTELDSADRDFTASAPQPTDLTPHTKKYSALIAGHHQINSRLDVFGDALVSIQNLHRRARQSAASFQDYEIKSMQQSYNLGLGVRLFSDWRAELRGSYGEQSTDSYFDVYQPALPNYTPGTRASGNSAKVAALEFRADGSLFQLPGGSARIAVGASYRDERFRSLATYMPVGSPNRLRFAERNVASFYGELYAPLVGPANSIPLLHRLDLSAAVRWDDYSDFSETTNPKIGLLWGPVEGLDFRASWSTSFRAPVASEQLSGALPAQLLNYVLPDPSGGTGRLFLITGGDPNLGPEESESWTLGFDLRPKAVPGLRLSVNYYDIHFAGRIGQAPFRASALSQPGLYGSLLTPLADDAASAAFLANMIAQGTSFTNIFGFGSTGVRYVLDLRLQNAASVDQSGYDISVAYGFEAGGNRFDLGASATITDEIVTGLTPESTPTDVVDTYSNPLSLRLRADLGWSRGAWRANAALNHRPGYTDTSASPTGPVDSWTTADFSVGYDLSAHAGEGSFLRGLSLALNITNAFDEDPPFVVGTGFQPGVHYDVGNADPYGRMISFQLSKRW